MLRYKCELSLKNRTLYIKNFAENIFVLVYTIFFIVYKGFYLTKGEVFVIHGHFFDLFYYSFFYYLALLKMLRYKCELSLKNRTIYIKKIAEKIIL